MTTLCILTLLAALAVAGPPGEPPPEKATVARVRPAAKEEPRILAMKSMPPRFRIVTIRDLPSAGWKRVADDVDVDESAGRIVVRATDHAPDGMAAQVITPTTLAFHVGALTPGAYVVEVRARMGTEEPYRAVDAFVIEAE